MRKLATCLSVAVIVGQAALAAPETSPRPVSRSDVAKDGAAVTAMLLRPVARPAWATRSAIQPLARAPTSEDLAANLPNPSPASLVMGETTSLRPQLRPDALVQKAMAKKRKEKRALKKGAICGDVALQGEAIGPVPGRIKGCGVPQAVRLRSVDGVVLSQASTMDCTTAKAIKRWVNSGARKAIGNYGGGLARIKVAAHYACRTRNNQPGAKISEHGKGRAIDISAVYTSDGTEISVLKDWGKGREGRMLRQMHSAACGPFGTVLGPNADRFHRDHFHFDTARYRSGSYCR